MMTTIINEAVRRSGKRAAKARRIAANFAAPLQKFTDSTIP
jgi:hypothetical protein